MMKSDMKQNGQAGHQSKILGSCVANYKVKGMVSNHVAAKASYQVIWMSYTYSDTFYFI